MDERAQLLRRILASRHFAYAETLKRVLRYVVERSNRTDDAPLSEHDIAVESIGRPAAFDPKLDPIVRVSMTSIRRRLDSYFEGEGRSEPLRLQISKGHYRALYMPNEHSGRMAEKGPANGPGPYLERFWRPYLAGEPANILVHSEPLFLRDDRGTRIRHIRLNNPETAPKEIGEIWPELEGSALVPYYAYLSVGAVYCMFAVTRVFHEAGVAIEMKSARSCAWQELRPCNLVLIGNVGANSYLDALQGASCFVLDDESVRDTAPQPDEKPEYRGERYREGKLPRHREYAVITRRPGLAPGATITMIGAIHGKAIEGAGQLLTSEDDLRAALQRLCAPGGGLPDYFQLLLEVEMIDVADEVVNVRCVAHRVLSQAG